MALDLDMLNLALRFRAEVSKKTADEMSRREGMRTEYTALRREADQLRQFRREAERRMMRHGIEIPDDDTQ